MDDGPDISEELVSALIVALLRRGVVSAEDFQIQHEDLSAEAENLLTALLIEATIEPMSERAFRLSRDGHEA